MFTGIVEEIGRVVAARPGKLEISAQKVLQNAAPGDSMAVNGVCLTLTTCGQGSFSVDIMPETGKRTNLGQVVAGDRVNLERPLTLGGRLGGHLVQGHVDGTVRLVSISREGQAMLLGFDTPPELSRYIVEKGFVALDGVSLTVVTRKEVFFQVSIVDYTWTHTNLGEHKLNYLANLEVDIIAKYVAQLTGRLPRSGITAGFLAEHGFLPARN